jgi:hypothetical protein
MLVFYVTATHSSLPRYPSESDERGRVDLAKFFLREHAEGHAKALAERRQGWRDVRVEEREEDADEQHPSHQGR